MRSVALSPEGLTQLTKSGTMPMRQLLTPSECTALAPPHGVEWAVEDSDSPPGQSWSHTSWYHLGSRAMRSMPDLDIFMRRLRRMVQANALEAGIPELTGWGDATPFSNYPVELFGFRRVRYGARWHRTPAGQRIDWHSDDSFDQAKEPGEFGVRALYLMAAFSLTSHGGTYRYAPATAATIPGTPVPSDPTVVRQIENIEQGDGVGFGAARDSNGGRWPGSFPLHTFVADDLPEPEDTEVVTRDSLVVGFHDVSARSLSDIGFSGVLSGVRSRLARR